MDSQNDIKQIPVGLHHMERQPLLDTWALAAEASMSQQRGDIHVHTGHMLLDVSSFCSRSHSPQRVRGAPHLSQGEVVLHITTAVPEAVSLPDQAERSQPWITWSLRWTSRDQRQALWNSSPSPTSWASARKLAASEKDVSATSVVQSSFRSDQWKDLPVVINKRVVESCQCFVCQPFEDYAELIHTVWVII